ncbi:thiolase C-terminal domain-containing protein [Mycolicibacterium vinylchloridicum]|uniref:thiolase C-terminal domain-containing protein n=1 Tax=Mycolicibacterium vinylchloridicum TaxID=2736928 RepID=UPI002D7E20F7|nr:lipid-transfer protein [Mycolicibacterium vinylchloridicum]
MSAAPAVAVSHRDSCAIAGIGATDFSRNSGRTTLTLATQAAVSAIADAGLERADIDGLVKSDYDDVQCTDLAHSLGLPGVTYWGATGIGGGAPCGMVGQAVAAIQAGLATNVLVYRALNGRSGVRFGKGSGVQRTGGAQYVGGNGSYEEFLYPYGVVAPGQMFAMVARRHMLEYGTTSDDLGSIAMTVRARANANPAAQMHDRTMNRQQYDAAPLIADPLRLFDHCLETDGACAVVVTSAERASDRPHPRVLIRAVSQGMIAEPQSGSFLTALFRESLTDQPSAQAARTLYRRAGMGPDEVDVAQFYDCFTITLLLQLEDYGFCAKGEGGPFATSGAIDLGGRLPVNTAGGNLSEGYIHGLNHVLEGVRQMRGTSTSQVDGAQTCLVTSGVPVNTSAMILRKG